MRKNILMFIVGLFSISFFAQVDVIPKHSKDTASGKVVRVGEYIVVYKYDGEDAENPISKYSIEKIVYGKSGRVQDFTEKIVVNGVNDREKVVILKEKSCVADPKKGGEVRGKTRLINLQTGNTGEKKVEKKLKMAAAAIGCPFIPMTSDKTTVEANSNAIEGT